MNANEFFPAMVAPLRRMTDFSGRSTRGQFWPFVFLLYAAQQIVAVSVIMPPMTKFQTDVARNPEMVTEAYAQAFIIELMSSMAILVVILSLMWLLPLAAALVRRLHDVNRSGRWALPSLAFQILSFAMIWWAWTAFQAESESGLIAAIIALVVNNLVGLGFTILLIVWCAQDGTVGPNLYGPDPKGRTPATAN